VSALPRLLILLILPIALAGCASFSRQILYSPDPSPASAHWTGQPPQQVSARTAEDLELKGYFWPGPPGDPDIFVFFHGRNWSAGRSADFVQPLARTGNGVLVASYRGFGDNPGRPSQARMLEDAEAFIDIAAARAGPGARIWLVGHSIGAAVALRMATTDERIRGVFAMSAFARVAEAAPRLARAFIPDRWDNLEALGTLNKPVILLQGVLDRFIPDDSGDALFSAYAGPASLIVGEDSRHNPDMKALAPWFDKAITAMQGGSLADLPPPPAGWIEKVRRP